MQTGKRTSPFSYFHRILIDGAKPFRYRKGIYSLLGIADKQKKKITSGILQLTSLGFPYPNRNSPAYQYKDFVKDDQNIRLASKQMDKASDPFLIAPESQHKISSMEPDSSRGIKPVASFIKDTVHDSPESAPGESKILSETDKDAMIKRTPEITDQKKTIDIPGISIKQTSFRALTVNENLGNSDTYRTGLDDQNTSQKELTDQKTSMPGIRHSVSNTINYLAQHDNPSSPADKSNGHLGLNLDQKKKLLIKASAKKSSHDLEDEKIFVNLKDIFVSGGGRPGDLNVNRILNSQGINKEDISGKIERIRQSMQEFYLKKYQRLEEKANKNDESSISHPVKQNIKMPTKKIVIIKRDSVQERGQFGFWERSYLSRFNMMPLR